MEFTQIRAKKISYLSSPAIAIYFQNMTQYIHQIRLESQILEEKNINHSLQTFTSTISHEFRTPLSTSLMLLEQLMQSNLSNKAKSIILIIISQLNLLLCLVNDVLDIKMINQGQYQPKIQTFSPEGVFKFIKDMFQPQSELQRIQVSF